MLRRGFRATLLAGKAPAPHIPRFSRGRRLRLKVGVPRMPTKTNSLRKRFDFSKIPATIQIPNLIEVQKWTYDRFLQMDRLPSERDDAGVQAVVQSVVPLDDFSKHSALRFA